MPTCSTTHANLCVTTREGGRTGRATYMQGAWRQDDKGGAISQARPCPKVGGPTPRAGTRDGQGRGGAAVDHGGQKGDGTCAAASNHAEGPLHCCPSPEKKSGRRGWKHGGLAVNLSREIRFYESAKRIYESNGQSMRVPWYLGTLPWYHTLVPSRALVLTLYCCCCMVYY